MKRTLFAHLTIAILLVLGFRLLSHPYVLDGPFSYDEADYMYAVSQGYLANWTDRPALSLSEFVRLGLHSGREVQRRTELSETIRGSGDILFYRHWHGPLYYYSLLWTRHGSEPVGGQERMVRSASLWIPAVGVGLVYLGCAFLLPDFPAAALLAAVFYGASYTVATVSELAPHQLFVILSLASLVFLAKFDVTRDRRWWWCSVAAAALSFATMEVAFVGVAVLLLYAWRRRIELGTDLRFWIRSVALFIVAVLATWPAGILKLEPLRSYMFMAYLAVFRKGAWGDVTFAETWETRFQSGLAEWLLIVLALLIWRRSRQKPWARAAQPFLLFGVLMLAVMLKVYATSPRYALPFHGSLMVFAGLVLGSVLEGWAPPAKWVTSAVMCSAVIASTWHYLQMHPSRPNLRSQQILQTVNAHPLDGRRVLVPQGDVTLFHYYFPRVSLKLYRNDVEKQAALAAGGIDAVIAEGEPVRLEYR
jgi:hypothetical protein